MVGEVFKQEGIRSWLEAIACLGTPCQSPEPSRLLVPTEQKLRTKEAMGDEEERGETREETREDERTGLPSTRQVEEVVEV